MKLGQMLVKAGVITREQLESALNAQRDQGGRLGLNLVRMNLINEEDLNSYLSRQIRIEAINIEKMKIEADVLQLVPAKLAIRYEVIPVERVGKTLVVAMADPHNLFHH